VKRLVYRKLVIPANVQPYNLPEYNLVFDKGTEEVNIMFTRTANSFNSYLVAFKPSGTQSDYSSQLFSTTVNIIKSPTLFHNSLRWTLFLETVQPTEITVEYISLVDYGSYILS